MLNDRLANAVIAIVTGVWTANFVGGLFLEDYRPDQTIHAIFMAIVGGTFALKRNKPGDSSPRGGRHER